MNKSFLSSRALLFFSLLSVLVGFSSCSHQIKTGMGGFADISLNRNSSEYDIKRLPEVSGTGNAIFGIPYTSSNAARNKTGFVFRLNGVTIGRVPRILPILTLLTTTLSTGYYVQTFVGLKDNAKNFDDYKLSYGVACLLALPVTGFANNLTWKNVAVANVLHEMNYQLVDQNPDIDVFASPKYLVNNKWGVWTQNADAKVNVLGARIRTERVVVPRP
ncbi:hypothetical protein [Aquirufa sp.]|uniref:hypothetical protein n=1 Tax=Aquirufa sp. TaxID=2676249 RepID=UPI0037BFB19A